MQPFIVRVEGGVLVSDGSGIRFIKFDEAQHPREPAGSANGGQFAGGGAGDYNPADREKYYAMRAQWGQINNKLLEHVDNPGSPEANALMGQMKDVVKEWYTLHADPGGPEGIGLPGGPRDITIVGAGPGGLAAAVMGGTDGLDTLVIDASLHAGGQAKFSSRIENYPGFPIGTSGENLAHNLYDQTRRLGAETKLGVRVVGITHDEATGLKTLELSNGEKIQSRSVIIAGGVEFSKMTFEGADSKKIVYGDAKQLSMLGAGGQVVVLGGSNGAAQAALGCANDCSHVTLVARSNIEKGMSDYQVVALRAHPKITVVENDEIARYANDKVYTKQGKEIDAKALGIFIGGRSNTGWLPPTMVRDGKVGVNGDLETTMPGVFAVGDIRHGSIGRIGAAVGDGQLAAKNAYTHVQQTATKRKPKSARVVKNKRRQEQWNHLVDEAFAVDAAHPFIGQTVDPTDAAKKPKVAFLYDESGMVAIKYTDAQPRDPSGSSTGGQWTSGGGGGAAGGDHAARPTPIHAKNIADAVKLILEGKVVELGKVDDVHTVLTKLADMAQQAKAEGKDAPKFDLCNVSVAGSNLFCGSKLQTAEFPNGVPRISMPQLGGFPREGSEAAKLPRTSEGGVDATDQFVAHLKSIGIGVTTDEVPASYLRASQAELIGSKIAGMMAAKDYNPGKIPIFISRDNYVVDGHHRWAAMVGRDAADNRLGDLKMHAIRINAPISEVLHLANAWTDKFGIKPVGAKSFRCAGGCADLVF